MPVAGLERMITGSVVKCLTLSSHTNRHIHLSYFLVNNELYNVVEYELIIVHPYLKITQHHGNRLKIGCSCHNGGKSI